MAGEARAALGKVNCLWASMIGRRLSIDAGAATLYFIALNITHVRSRG